jgi:hypothetical protein
VTTVCRLGRSIPVALRSALFERDRTCVVPGCDRTAGLECDHWVVPFAEGGPVSLDNLARLCTHHHRLRTHRGFRLSNHSGTWIWEPPDHPKPTTTRSTRPSRSTRPTRSNQPTPARARRARTAAPGHRASDPHPADQSTDQPAKPNRPRGRADQPFRIKPGSPRRRSPTPTCPRTPRRWHPR